MGDTIYYAPDILVTTFAYDGNTYVTAMTFADLQRLYPAVRRDTHLLTADQPALTTVCWKWLADVSDEDRAAVGVR